MHRSLIRAAPAIGALAIAAVLLGHLMAPNALLVVRDVPIFHAPLRAVFGELANEGLPAWNPRIHGGQPILSNPNYASFYPPTWFALLLPPPQGLSWLLILHFVFGFVGAWRLARRFGCQRPAAGLSACAFSAGGGMLSALNGVTTFCSAVWLPWALLWSDRWFRDESPSKPILAAGLPAFALAMQVLAGEPAIALTSSIAVGLMAVTANGKFSQRVRRLGVVGVLAALLAAIQLLPTMAQVGDSARSGEFVEESMVWSTRPVRLVELALPRLFGDPMGLEEDLYFGWKVHDRSFPYVISIYCGQLVLVLGLAALLRWSIPRRWFLAALGLAGVFLALGRFNPIYTAIAPALPILDLVRYPEKFILLTTTALAFAAGLGWQHLLDHRTDEGPAREDFVVALSGVVAGLILVFGLTLAMRPDVAEWFVRQNTLSSPLGERLEIATVFLKKQVWIGLLVTLGSLCVLALHRFRRVPSTALIPLTLAVLAIDLFCYNGNLAPAIPFSELDSPPPHLQTLDPTSGRVFTDELLVGRDEFVPRSARPGPDALWAQADRAEPYLGNLWGFSYALHIDFDRMLTEPARQAFELVARHWSEPELVRSILASWGVRYWLHNRTVTEVTLARLRGQELLPVEIETLPRRQPLLSWVPGVTWHQDTNSAETAAAQSEFREAHWIGSPSIAKGPAGRPETIHNLTAKHSSTLLDYESTRPLLVIINTTYDKGWEARIDGAPAPVHRTALGQIGLELPSGAHVLRLNYRTPYLLPGALVTASTVLLLVLGGTLPPARRLRA